MGTQLLTRRDLADLLGVHMGTIVKWDRDGMPVAERGRKGKPSQYDEAAVRAWLAAREEAARAPGAPMDVAQERAKKEHWQALLAEQTHRVRERELLPAAEVEKVWSAERDAIRTKVLASYATAADRVHRAATLEGVAGVERALKDIAYGLLRELAGEPAEPVKRRKEQVA
jgi:phage terminase Nu1 subunit (DNA packaging protein)